MTLESKVGIARTTLRAILFFVVTAWVAAVPTRLGIIVFDEQFMLAMIGLAATLVFLTPRSRHSPVLRAVDLALAAVTLAVFGYVAIELIAERMSNRTVVNPPELFWLSIVMLATVLEATRRKTGWVLPILILVLVVFFVFISPYSYMPPEFQTLPLKLTSVPALATDSVAMLNRIMVIVGLVVIPFIVFGFLLNAFGGGSFYTGLATRLVGRYRGGPAKVSVVGSAAFGMVSGSAVANVVTIGAVSIPLMSRTGYKRHTAAAIEAVTSTGGQLMPPIMGASAFLMSEILEIPYQEIVIAAILPALFFYVALFLAVDFEARRLDIPASSPESLGLVGADNWTRGWRYLIPVAVLLHLLFVESRSPAFASFYTVITLMAVHMFWPVARVPAEGEQPLSAAQVAVRTCAALWPRFKKLVRETLNCMGASTEIILLGATAGIIMGLLFKTGFASNVTLQMVLLSGGKLVILLALAGLLGIFLGMGMPTVGVYILLAVLAAPALVTIGIEPLAAHLYVLYFGMLSMITPPVAIACFAAASVAETNTWKTAFSAVRVGAAVYLVPIAFVTQPELLFIGNFDDTAVAILRLVVAVGLFTCVFIGHGVRHMAVPWRVIGVPLAVLNILPLGGGFDLYLWAAFGLAAVVFAGHLIPPRAPRQEPRPQLAE